MIKELNPEIANEIVVHLIESTKKGRVIEFFPDFRIFFKQTP